MKNSKKIFLFCAITLLLLVYGCKGGGGGAEKIKDATSVELTDSKRTEVEQQNILERNLTNQFTNIKPKIFITEPDDGEKITARNFKIEWVAADRNNDLLLITLEYKRMVEGKELGGWIRIADYRENDGKFLWDFKDLSDGRFKLKATVTDGELSADDVTGEFIIYNTYNLNPMEAYAESRRKQIVARNKAFGLDDN